MLNGFDYVFNHPHLSAPQFLIYRMENIKLDYHLDITKLKKRDKGQKRGERRYKKSGRLVQDDIAFIFAFLVAIAFSFRTLYFALCTLHIAFHILYLLFLLVVLRFLYLASPTLSLYVLVAQIEKFLGGFTFLVTRPGRVAQALPL